MIDKSQFMDRGTINLTDQSQKDLISSPYYNDDLKPVAASGRTWGTYNYISFWVGLCICITTYMIASGLIAMGLTPFEALLAIFLGQLIVLVPMLLNSIPGTKYGIPFPVYARISMGPRGAQIATILRGVAGAGWFAIMSWLGGEALHVLLVKFAPSLDFPGSIWIFFIFFWGLTILIGIGGPNRIGRLASFAAPIMIVLSIALLIWGVSVTEGLGPVFSQASQFTNAGDFIAVFLPAMVGTTAYWATLALNIPDVTRYAKNQKSQLVGQAITMPLAMAFLSFVSVVATTAGSIAFGDIFWDPVQLMAHFPEPVVLIAAIGFVLATLTVNLGANMISPVNDIINLIPSKLSWKKGVAILAVISLVMQPWNIMANHATFFYGWLDMLAIFMAPLAGIFIVDYYIHKKQKLNLKELYVKEKGRYYYNNGFNVKAIAALVIAVLIAMIGKFVPSMEFLNTYTYLTGLLFGALIYFIIIRKDKSALEPGEFELITSSLESSISAPEEVKAQDTSKPVKE
jgi:NCS1 family nucleobase:cation symporter-1